MATLIPTHTVRIITHTAMATRIPTTAAGITATIGVDMIVAGSMAASAVDSAAMLSVAADFMAVAADIDNSHEFLIPRQLCPVVRGTVRQMMLTGAFALMALLAASFGIYPVVSYAFAQRTGEVGMAAVVGPVERTTAARASP